MLSAPPRGQRNNRTWDRAALGPCPCCAPEMRSSRNKGALLLVMFIPTWWLSGKESASTQETQETQQVRFQSLGRKWKPTPAFFPEKFHGQRSLVGSSPQGHKRVGHNWAAEHNITENQGCLSRSSGGVLIQGQREGWWRGLRLGAVLGRRHGSPGSSPKRPFPIIVEGTSPPPPDWSQSPAPPPLCLGYSAWPCGASVLPSVKWR